MKAIRVLLLLLFATQLAYAQDDLKKLLAYTTVSGLGALVLLISLIIGVAVYGVTSNWRWVISSVMVAFLIGYGVDIVQGIGGVTATVDMLATPPIDIIALDPALPGPR